MHKLSNLFHAGEHMTEYELAEYLTTLLGFNAEGGSSELQEFDSSTAGDIIDQNLPVNVTEEMFASEILGFPMYRDTLAQQSSWKLGKKWQLFLLWFVLVMNM